MSLSITRSIATSALMTTQVQINVASANIANADTDGYTRKIATQTSTVYGGTNAGTIVTGTTSIVDKYLVKALTTATATAGAAQVTDTYASRLQQLMGSVSSNDGTGTSIAASLADLETALQELAQTPESETLQSQAISSLDTVASQLRETSAGIQDLRADADAAVGDAVAEVNDLLRSIKSLNDQITQGKSTGQSTADLEDKRSAALVSLSERLDVTSFVNSSGQLQIYTSSGQTLLDSRVHELSYDPAATVSSTTTFNGIMVDGKDITSQIKSGSVAALIEQRDTILPDAQAELDQLAQALASSLNSVHNQGTAVPLPSQLASTATVAASDAFSGTGTVRLATVDQDGKLGSFQDLDLSSYATIGDLVAAIDGVSGISATIDASGRLVIAAENAGEGVAIGEQTSAVGSTQSGFSQWFGLNDLVTATGASDFSVASRLLEDPSALATSSLSDAASLTGGEIVVSEGETSIVDQLAVAFSDSVSFAAVGTLGASKTTFANYAASIVGTISTAASNAANAYDLANSNKSDAQSAVSSQSGVNLDEETARLSELENMYSSATQILSIVNAMFESLMEAVQSA